MNGKMPCQHLRLPLSIRLERAGNIVLYIGDFLHLACESRIGKGSSAYPIAVLETVEKQVDYKRYRQSQRARTATRALAADYQKSGPAVLKAQSIEVCRKVAQSVSTFSLLTKRKQFLYRTGKHLGDIHGELQRWVVSAFFQVDDSFPP